MRQYYWKYVKRLDIKTKFNFGLALGSVAHTALDRIIKTRDSAEKQLPGVIFQEEWKKAKEKAGALWLDQEDLEDVPESVILSRAGQLVSGVAAAYQGLEILGTEEHVVRKFDRYHELHGYMDVRFRTPDGLLEIRDFKFGKQAKSEGDIINFWHQFVSYPWMAQEVFGGEYQAAMHTGAISLAAKPKADFKHIIFPVKLDTKNMLVQLHDRMKYLVQHVLDAGCESDPVARYPHTGRAGGCCGWCDFANICDGTVAESAYKEKAADAR
jgi:hypothetical protein